MDKAILSLIIFGIAVALFIWNKLPQSIVALLGLTAMILCNVETFSQGFKNFAGSTVVLILCMMVVGRAAFDTGLASLVGNKIISLARGNERLVVILGTLITAIMSTFLPNTSTNAVMIAIMTNVCGSDSKIRYKNVIMPICMAGVIGGAATLVGSTPQLTAQGIIEQEAFLGEGNGFTFTTFLAPGFIIIAALVLYVAFIGYPLGKKIWGNSEDYNESPTATEDDKMDKTQPKKSKMIIMSVIFIAMILMFLFTDQIKENFIPTFNIAMVSLISALACILTGCITHKNAVKSINWSLGIWFCSTLGMAEGMNVSGGSDLLAKWFMGLIGENISAYGLFAASVIFVVVLTQFISNSTVLTIALPILLPLIMKLGYNPFPYAVGMTMGCAMAVATPLANATIGMSMVGKYKFTDYTKYAGPLTLICLAILLILVPIFWPLVG